MAIQGVGASSPIQPIEFPTLDKATGTQDAGNNSNFGNSITDALGNLQGVQTKTDDLAMQVATGQLTDIQDYMIAANQAEIATQLTVAVKNKAVDAFNQIMNMQV